MLKRRSTECRGIEGCAFIVSLLDNSPADVIESVYPAKGSTPLTIQANSKPSNA
jgi:hypothetical protein